MKPPYRALRAERAGVYGIAAENRLGVHDRGDLAQEVGRGAIVDRDEHHAFEERAPQRRDPLGPILAPDRDRLAADDAARSQREGERLGLTGELGVGPRPRPIAVVEREELRTVGRVRAIGGDIGEEVEERAPRHEG